MKGQKRKQKPIKIIAATSMTLFSLFACFMGTYAWFNAVRSQNSETNGFSIDAGSSIDILSCYAIRYDGNYGAIAYDVYSNNQTAITMSEYDYIFTDRNVNTPLFLRMEIAGFTAANDLTITIPCTGSYKTDNKVDPWLSNVVCAKFMRGLKVNGSVVADTYSWTGSEVHTANVVSCYQGMLENAKGSTGTPYVSNNSKQNSVTLTLTAASIFYSNSPYIVQRTNSQGDTVDAVIIFVALDYYVNTSTSVNLVEEYIKSYDDNDTHSYSFASDISSIILTNEGSAS